MKTKDAPSTNTIQVLTAFEEMDHQASALKDEARTICALAVMFLSSFVLIPAFNGPGQSMFDLNRVPWFLMIASPLMIGASITGAVLACKYVNRRTAEKKSLYRQKLDAVAALHESIEVDDSGLTPKLKQKVS